MALLQIHFRVDQNKHTVLGCTKNKIIRISLAVLERKSGKKRKIHFLQSRLYV